MLLLPQLLRNVPFVQKVHTVLQVPQPVLLPLLAPTQTKMAPVLIFRVLWVPKIMFKAQKIARLVFLADRAITRLRVLQVVHRALSARQVLALEPILVPSVHQGTMLTF